MREQAKNVSNCGNSWEASLKKLIPILMSDKNEANTGCLFLHRKYSRKEIPR